MVAPVIVEVAPRDGLQNERVALSPSARAELIAELVAAGARRIEAVAFVHPDRVPQMAGAEEVMSAVPRTPGVSYAGLVLNRRGLERAVACGVDEVNVVVPCTDAMSLRNQGRDVGAMLAEMRAIVGEARAAGKYVTVTAAVAFGCPFSGEVSPDHVRRVVGEAADAGADEIALADTIGVGVPAQVKTLLDMTAELAPGIATRVHFHNTRNTGYANAAAAIDKGVGALDASVGGFGGCPFAPAATGNVATEDLDYLMRRSGLSTGLQPAALTAAAERLGQRLGRQPDALLGRAGDFPPSEP